MGIPELHSVRLVVQRAQAGLSPGYRLVAYPPPQGTKFQPVNFSSRELLLKRLKAALPEFDSQLLEGEHSGEIIFAREVALSIAQLSVLGLLY